MAELFWMAESTAGRFAEEALFDDEEEELLLVRNNCPLPRPIRGTVGVLGVVLVKLNEEVKRRVVFRV